jgi:hypothetical protein
MVLPQSTSLASHIVPLLPPPLLSLDDAVASVVVPGPLDSAVASSLEPAVASSLAFVLLSSSDVVGAVVVGVVVELIDSDMLPIVVIVTVVTSLPVVDPLDSEEPLAPMPASSLHAIAKSSVVAKIPRYPAIVMVGLVGRHDSPHSRVRYG